MAHSIYKKEFTCHFDAKNTSKYRKGLLACSLKNG